MPEAAGEHWAQTFLRLALQTQRRALFTRRMFNLQDVDNLFEQASAHTLVLKFGKQGQDNYFAVLPVGEAISNKATVCNPHNTGQGTRSHLFTPRFKGYSKLGQAQGR